MGRESHEFAGYLFMGAAAKWLLEGLLLLSVLAALPGCVSERIEPHYASHSGEPLAGAPLPDLTLTHRVTLAQSTKEVRVMWSTSTVDAVGTSRFGDIGDIADPRCIVDGLREALPTVSIVPTERFWAEVAEGQETIPLASVLQSPVAGRLRAIGVDVLIATRHEIVDVETGGMETLISGVYSNRDRETATLAAFDVETGRVIHTATTQYMDNDGGGHFLFVVPFAVVREPTFELCETLGQRAGEAIAASSPPGHHGILVVVADEDPYAATRDMQ